MSAHRDPLENEKREKVENITASGVSVNNGVKGAGTEWRTNAECKDRLYRCREQDERE